MIAAATAQGYFARRRGHADARRSVPALTGAGQELLEESHRWQRERFLELTADWGSGDRARFAAYLERLAHEVGA